MTCKIWDLIERWRDWLANAHTHTHKQNIHNTVVLAIWLDFHRLIHSSLFRWTSNNAFSNSMTRASEMTSAKCEKKHTSKLATKTIPTTTIFSYTNRKARVLNVILSWMLWTSLALYFAYCWYGFTYIVGTSSKFGKDIHPNYCVYGLAGVKSAISESKNKMHAEM